MLLVVSSFNCSVFNTVLHFKKDSRANVIIRKKLCVALEIQCIEFCAFTSQLKIDIRFN